MALIKAPTQATGEILFFVTCILCIIIIAPTLIYYTVRFNQYKNTILLRKRYPTIIIIILILLIIGACIRTPLTVLVVTPTHLPIKQSDFVIAIESFLNIYLSHAIILLIALRFWMIFYKINYTYSSSTSAWKTVINPLISTNNWFLKPSNKATFGNAKSMFCRYFFPFYIIYGTLDFVLLSANRWSILFEFHLSYFQLIDALYYTFVMLFCVYLYKQTPNWEDHCFIRAEMRLGSLVILICIIIYILNSCIFLIFEIVSPHTANEYIQSIITSYIELTFGTLYGLILTAYPTNKISLKPSDLSRASSPDQIEMIIQKKGRKEINKTTKKTHKHNHTHTKTHTARCRALSEPTTTLTHSIINNRNKIIENSAHHSQDDEIIILRNNNTYQQDDNDDKRSELMIDENDLNIVLSDILSDAILFDRFMNYLSRSFSTESLLSFVEFYQFKQFIILQFENELILNDDNKIFIHRLKIKLQSKRNNIKKIRNGRSTHNVRSAFLYSNSNLFNVILPDSVPKSYVVFGDFMINHLIKGKSIKKSMGKLEKSASKFGLKLYQQEQEKQRKIQHNLTQQTTESSKSKSNPSKSTKKEISKTPSKILAGSELFEQSKSEKSKSDRLHITPQNTITKTEKLKKTNSARNSIKNKPRYPSIHSQTITFAGSYNSVKLQIPDTKYVCELEDAKGIFIHTSIESVTEKDIYDHDHDDMKVGTPSLASQTIPTVLQEMTSIETIETIDMNMNMDNLEESQTTTYPLQNDPKHLTGGVSVEVDEHLDKNREISVTPQPSSTSVVTSITNVGHNPSTIFVRNLSQTNTMTKTSKYHRNRDIIKKGTPITPYGSRQRFGSTTATLSVTMDEKEMQDIQKNIVSSNQEVNQSPNSGSKSKSKSNRNSKLNSSLNTPPVLFGRGIGFGDMPMDMQEARNKVRVIAHKLYMKYCNTGAEFEINIPHRIRKKLIQLRLNNLDEWLQDTQSSINELYNVFNECMEEMFALMRSSISVFLDSQDYQQD